LVSHLLAKAALWVRIQTSPKKYIMSHIRIGVANTLQPTEKIYNKKVFFSVYKAVQHQTPENERQKT
jgi:hypothetical protein